MSDIYSLFCPYPTVSSEGVLTDGLIHAQPSYCRNKCGDRVCRLAAPSQAPEDPQFHTCPHGYSVSAVQIDDSIVRINGVVELTSSTATPEFRKVNRKHKIKLQEYQSWLTRVNGLTNRTSAAIQQAARDSVGALHEIKSLISTILHTSETWIYEFDGRTVDERIERCPVPLRTIYHSCRILESLLQFADVVANPDAANFGTTIPRNLYRIIHMLQRVYEARATGLGLQIRMYGNSYKEPPVLSSFIIVPLVLLDNAIKHSDTGTEIRIEFRDETSGSVKIKFVSYGLIVPVAERDAIFKRAVRGSNAGRRGSGLGLYVAQQVARANGFELTYSAIPRPGDRARGENSFSFEVPTGR